MDTPHTTALDSILACALLGSILIAYVQTILQAKGEAARFQNLLEHERSQREVEHKRMEYLTYLTQQMEAMQRPMAAMQANAVGSQQQQPELQKPLARQNALEPRPAAGFFTT